MDSISGGKHSRISYIKNALMSLHMMVQEDILK